MTHLTVTHSTCLVLLICVLLLPSLCVCDMTRDHDSITTTTTVRQGGCGWKTNQCSFVDRFEKENKVRWMKSFGYANGIPFANWWSEYRANFNKNRRRLELSIYKAFKYGKQYAAGEVRTHGWHGYGCYEVRMRPVAREGVTSTFFAYTGPYNAAPGATKQHNEIDIEFVWGRQRKQLAMQTNFFTAKKGAHEKWLWLPFRAEERMHNYGFKWTQFKIEWYVDGQLNYTVWDKPDDPIPKLWQGPLRIFMSFWPVTYHAAGWIGTFRYDRVRTVEYEAVRFTRGQNCRIQNKF